jgi:hypothetical protein
VGFNFGFVHVYDDEGVVNILAFLIARAWVAEPDKMKL